METFQIVVSAFSAIAITALTLVYFDIRSRLNRLDQMMDTIKYKQNKNYFSKKRKKQNEQK